MSYTAIEEKISKISGKYQQELLDFVDFLLYKQNTQSEDISVPPETQQKLDALNSIYGILTPEESKAVEQSTSDGIKFKEVQV